MPEDYSYWRARIAGEKPLLTRDAEPGFWRWKRKPLAVWMGPDLNGVVYLMRKLGSEQPTPVDREWSESVFSRACSDPVTEAEYRNALATGEWPDDPPKVGHNKGPEIEPEDPYDQMVRLLQEQEEAVEMWLGDDPASVIIDKPSCDRAANWASEIGTLEKKLEDSFRIEKQPWLDGGRAVDTKWREPRTTADELKKRLKNAQLPYLSEQDRLRREREAAQREEERKARLAGQPAPIQQQEPVRNTNAGSVGRKTSLVKTKVAVIEDYAKALDFLKDTEEVKQVVRELCAKAARAGVPVPGTKIEEREGVR